MKLYSRVYNSKLPQAYCECIRNMDILDLACLHSILIDLSEWLINHITPQVWSYINLKFLMIS